MVACCPIMWLIKIQMEIALSKMDAEYVALGKNMKELLPVSQLVNSVAETVVLYTEEMSNMHVSVQKYNAGCLILAKMELPRMTAWSKHYCTKYHWLKEKRGPNQS